MNVFSQNTWDNPFTQPQGWVCPKCGRVWSPNVDACQHCNPRSTANSKDEQVHTIVQNMLWRHMTEMMLHSWDG